jgi:hypothetical protein
MMAMADLDWNDDRDGDDRADTYSGADYLAC